MDIKSKKKIIPGLLIEGEDYSGKSTVAKLLLPKLQEKLGKIIVYNHYYLSSDDVISCLIEQARSGVSGITKRKLFAAAAMIDYDLFEIQPNTFYLQDRNWLSHINGNQFLNHDIILKKRFAFEYNIFLTVDLQEQKRRMNPNTPIKNSHYTIKEIKQLIPSTENWHFINTTQKIPLEVANKILSLIAV